jgi:phosphatidylserine synthase
MYGIGRSPTPADAYRRAVVDRALRPLKARLFSPLTVALAGVPADAVTAAGLAVGVAAALLAAAGHFELALAAWWANRLLDGLDGELARAARRPRRVGGAASVGTAPATSARGAYLDLMADLLVYAAVPLGLAAGATGSLTGVATDAIGGPTAVWIAAAATAAAYYVNLGSWTLLSALLPRADGAVDPEATGVRMPAGLVEGTETIVLVSVGLLWPAGAAVTLGATALLTLASAAHRTWWGARRLGEGAGS